jgi:hypothetical protein
MAYLMRYRDLSMLDSLDYLKSVHPSTGPLPDQIASLQSWYNDSHGFATLPPFFNQTL